jgi:hypothetical protein
MNTANQALIKITKSAASATKINRLTGKAGQAFVFGKTFFFCYPIGRDWSNSVYPNTDPFFGTLYQ